jgi:hypothetical protein
LEESFAQTEYLALEKVLYERYGKDAVINPRNAAPEERVYLVVEYLILITPLF